LHPGREPLEALQKIRESQGEYNFAGQYQQAPAPFGGGMVKAGWFKTYSPAELPKNFAMTFQSWDTANKPSELNDHAAASDVQKSRAIGVTALSVLRCARTVLRCTPTLVES